MRRVRATNSPEGWSSRGGQPRNAYNLSVTPSVSSSGSATSVAANLVAVSVGSETDGSIIGPAGINGVVGMKPTFGLIPVAGVIPLSPSMDNLGPMARTVMDTAILLDAMIPESERPQDHPSSYAQNLQENNIRVRHIVINISKLYLLDGNVLIVHFFIKENFPCWRPPLSLLGS